MASFSIAVVEDNNELLFELLEFLTLRGFHTQGFAHGKALLDAMQTCTFDLILLDIMLPDQSGYDIAAQIRANSAQSQVGIIMLTALSGDHDHLQGLHAGADVFLTKHSSLEVIEAACRSLLQRLPKATAIHEPWCLCQQQWLINSPTQEKIALTHSEVILLAALMQNPGQAVSRAALLALLNKPESLSNLRNLDNTVSRLRRKCQEDHHVDLPVRPCYGKGYTFTEACVIKTCV